MITLQITPEKEAALNVIEDLSMQTVKRALRGEIPAEGDQVKIAVSTLSLVAKNRQIATKRAAFEFGVAVSTATEEQLSKYIEVTSPKIHKALGKSDTIIESEVTEDVPGHSESLEIEDLLEEEELEDDEPVDDTESGRDRLDFAQNGDDDEY